MPETNAPKLMTYVVLLRGINVGRGRSLRMADLRALCIEAGSESVETYIQSGNVVLQSSMEETALASHLAGTISTHAGFDIPVVTRTADEFASIVERCPFDLAVDFKTLVVSFVQELPAGDATAGVDPDAFGKDRFVLDGRELFMHLPDGQSKSKLATVISRTPFGKGGTVRNWKTITTLDEMTR